MRKIIAVLIGIVIGILTYELFEVAYAQQVNIKNTMVTWDSPSTDPSIAWTDITGAAETMASFDLAISHPSEDLNLAGSAITSSFISYADAKINGSWETEITELLKSQPSGNYLVWCRAVDLAGNKSTWSNSEEIPHDIIPPGQPKNIAIKIVLLNGTTIELRVKE
jgi:predicted phage tail protein